MYTVHHITWIIRYQRIQLIPIITTDDLKSCVLFHISDRELLGVSANHLFHVYLTGIITFTFLLPLILNNFLSFLVSCSDYLESDLQTLIACC